MLRFIDSEPETLYKSGERRWRSAGGAVILISLSLLGPEQTLNLKVKAPSAGKTVHGEQNQASKIQCCHPGIFTLRRKFHVMEHLVQTDE